VLFDDFDSIQNTAIGTITGGLLFGTPPATGNFIGVDSVDFTTTIVTVTFTNPVSYVGFAWGTSDSSNEVDVYDGSTLSAHFLATRVLIRSQSISTSMPTRGRPSLSLS
jgi:hypothetical protein